MPLCTSCTTPVQQLYTVYGSEDNSRLEQCPKCLKFADPYVEYDAFNLLLDLILLRRGVFRHLIFNRGSRPKKISGSGSETIEPDDGRYVEDMEKKRMLDVLKIGFASILADSFTRWVYHYPLVKARDGSEIRSWDLAAGRHLLITILGCLLETVSFHVGVVLSSILLNYLLNILGRRPVRSIRKEVRASHISLTLLYSSFTKLFMLLALSIWHPENISVLTRFHHYHPIVQQYLPWLDVDRLDRRWVARNVLGGTTSSFGLRVALECNPILVILIILAGWVIKTWVSSIASLYIGSQASHMDGYLLYALP